MVDTGRFHFEFVNTPYTDDTISHPMKAAREEERRKRKRHFGKTKTADKVADILEDRYAIQEAFLEFYEEEIEEIIDNTYDERMEAILEGELAISDISFERLAKPAFPKIEKMFREFLDKREMDGIVEGVPTKASIKHERQSFIDTGIYRASFRVKAD